jgi:hypothetical protein
MNRLFCIAVSVMMLLLTPAAFAKSSYLTSFTNAYPAANGSRIDSCQICHTNSDPDVDSARNAYGTAWKNNGKNFAAIEGFDSDGDGFSNINEINAFYFPGNASDKPVSTVTVPNVVGQTQAAAGTLLSNAGLGTGAVTQQCSNSVAAGLVISQNPAGGASVAPGTAVALVVSTGPVQCDRPERGRPDTGGGANG